MLEERGVRVKAKIDWLGNVTFAVGLIALLVGITYGILPYGGHTMGWTSPAVIAGIVGGLAILGLFTYIESRVAAPMFRLPLFRIRAFSAGSVATFLSALARGGLMFMLILWLQGVWLPEHGYSFSDTPLWAGIAMLPLSLGFLFAGPMAGRLADRFGARPFTTGGLITSAIGLLLLVALPVDFQYWMFGVVIFIVGFAMGLFAAPNQTGIMNALPPNERGAGAGMTATFMGSASVLSIGVFFSLIIIGLSSKLPKALYTGLIAHGVSHHYALKVSHLPPVGTLFSAFLGYNPMKTTLGPELGKLHHSTAAYLTGHRFFPTLVSHPFASGIHAAFYFAAGCCLVGAIASWMRGGKYYYSEPELEPFPDPAEAEEALATELAEIP
jgi:MFS family permease